LFFLSLNSCNYDKLNPNFEEVGICFDTEILPIFVSNCASSGCHNSEDRKEGLDLTYYGGIIKDIKPYNTNRSKLLEYMKDRGEDQMPPLPSEPVSASNISLIEEWINKGAPNTSICETSSCDTLSNISYAFDIQPILATYCYGCHSGPSAIGGYDLTNFNGVKSTVNNGTLIGSINYDSGYQPMPQNGNKLDRCRIKTIKTWIDEGARDN
jgi:hypothetical protein